MITTTAMSQQAKRRAKIVAVLMMLVGGVAILLPFYIGFATAALLGVAIAIVGAVGLLISRQVRRAGYAYAADGMYWLYLIAGGVMALLPQLTLGVLAFLLGFLLLLAGMLNWRAASMMPGASRLSSGITIMLGILVVISGASGVAWLIGVFFGVSVLLQGISLWQSVQSAPVILE